MKGYGNTSREASSLCGRRLKRRERGEQRAEAREDRVFSHVFLVRPNFHFTLAWGPSQGKGPRNEVARYPLTSNT